MKDTKPDTYAADITADNDRKNLVDIDRAVAEHRINEEAAEYLKTILKAGDSVLLKASNGMKLKEIVEGIKC